MEDWALIRRLAAEGVPKAKIAKRLGIARNTVAKAVASDGPPKYERRPGPTSFTPYADPTNANGQTGGGGSSPLVRGGHTDGPTTSTAHGLIPARAGRTS